MTIDVKEHADHIAVDVATVDDDLLEEKIIKRVHEWLERSVEPLFLGTHAEAVIELRVGEAGIDDEGEPYLSFSVTERLEGPFYNADSGGRVKLPRARSE